MAGKNILVTEEKFTLPIGYKDNEGTLHRVGTMRLATAADEILPKQDPRVIRNPDYLTVIILARVITELGSLNTVNTAVIESLYVKDYEYLLGLYNRLNENGYDAVNTECPKCKAEFLVEIPKPGE